MSETTTITEQSTSLAGAVTWFEVGTPDPEGARRFYGELFGWTFDVQGPYSVIGTGAGHPVAGGIQDTRMSPARVPATFTHFCVQVDDVAGTCGKVEVLGGKVLVPATTLPGGVTYAYVLDPTGAQFALWTPPAA